MPQQFNIDDAVRTLSQSTTGRPTDQPSTVPIVDLANLARRNKLDAEMLVPGITDFNTAHAKGLLHVSPDGRLHAKVTPSQRKIIDALSAGVQLPPEWIPAAQLKGGMDEARFPGSTSSGFGGLAYLKRAADGTIMVRNPDHPGFKGYADKQRAQVEQAKAHWQGLEVANE